MPQFEQDSNIIVVTETMATLTAKYYLHPCIQYSERIEAAIKGVGVNLCETTAKFNLNCRLKHLMLKIIPVLFFFLCYDT